MVGHGDVHAHTTCTLPGHVLFLSDSSPCVLAFLSSSNPSALPTFLQISE